MRAEIQEAISHIIPASKRSKLAPYLNEILELKAQGYSYNQIADALLVAYNLKTSSAKLCEYVNRQTKNKSAFKTVFNQQHTLSIKNDFKEQIEHQIEHGSQDRQALLERFATKRPKPVQGDN